MRSVKRRSPSTGKKRVRAPSPKFIGQANLVDPGIMERFSLERFPECFREYAMRFAALARRAGLRSPGDRPRPAG